MADGLRLSADPHAVCVTLAERLSQPHLLQLSVHRLIAAGVAIEALGILGTWSRLGGISVNGLHGANNGWIVILLSPLAVLATTRAARGSPRAIAAVALSGVLSLWTIVATQAAAGSTAGWGRWLSGVGALVLVTAAGFAVSQRGLATDAIAVDGSSDAESDQESDAQDNIDGRADESADDESDNADRAASPRQWVGHFASVGLLAILFVYVVLRQVIVVGEVDSWPPPTGAITAAGAQTATEEFAQRDTRPSDVGLDYAWSTAVAVEPHVEGVEFFPRILADIEAAESSIHILMFGWKAGDIGLEMANLLDQRLSEGVEVRVLVDGFGSAPFGGSADMFNALADAGAEIVVNDILPIDKDGILGARSFDLRHDELGRADHRKLYVIDGTAAWTGGAGIEDHFRNGEFHDVMARITGDVVRQAQAVFLTSFSSHDADLPIDLDAYFPEPEDPGHIPIAVLQVTPGGFGSAPQSVRELIDGASERLDVMNPYFTDKDMIDRIIRAAKRGVEVRIIVSERSNNAMATAAWRYRYEDVVGAGAEVWEYPSVVHAKVIVADDTIHVGTLNLDAWALYRDHEFAVMARDAATADRFRTQIFEVDIAASKPGRGPEGVGHVVSWFADKIVYFL